MYYVENASGAGGFAPSSVESTQEAAEWFLSDASIYEGLMPILDGYDPQSSIYGLYNEDGEWHDTLFVTAPA